MKENPSRAALLVIDMENGFVTPEERRPLYAQYADVIAVSLEGAEETAQQVLSLLRTVDIHL